MAETIVVQRGTHYTHNMHIYPDDPASALWASLEAQNAGYIQGMYQNNMLCTPMSHVIEVEKTWVHTYSQQLNIFHFLRWPLLGSYTQLSFDVKNIQQLQGAYDDDGPHMFVVYLRAGFNSPSIYRGTITEYFEPDETKRITFRWTMEEATLDDELEQIIVVNVIANRYLEEFREHGWILETKLWSMYTASLPL